MDKKAGVNFISIGMGFIALIIYVLLLPSLNEWITAFLPSVENNFLIFLIKLIPIAILLGILFRTFNQPQFYER